MGPPPCSRQPVNLGPDSQSRAGTWVRHRQSTDETDITHRVYRTWVRGSLRRSPECRPYRAGVPVAHGLHPQGGRRAWLGGQAVHVYVRAKSLHLCPTLCNPVDCSLPGSSVYGILQERIYTGVGCHALLQGMLVICFFMPFSLKKI